MADGSPLRVEPLAGDELEEQNGRPASGATLDDETVGTLRQAVDSPDTRS